MSTARSVSALLGLFFCQMIVAFFVNVDAGQVRDRKSAVGQNVPKLPAVDVARVAAIEISEPKSTVRLEKTDGEWVLPASARAPVRQSEIDDLLKLCVGFENSEHRAYDAVRPADYGLDPQTIRRLKLFDANGVVLIDLWVGKDDQPGGKAATEWGCYVRQDGASHIYSHAKRLSPKVRAGLGFWMEKSLFPGDPRAKNALVPTADRITLEFADLPPAEPVDPSKPAPPPAPDRADAPRVRVVLEASDVAVAAPEPATGPTPPDPTKPKAGESTMKRVWKIVEPADAGIEVFDGAADGVVRSILYASMMDVAGSNAESKEYGLGEPTCVAEVRFKDGGVKRITVGARATPSTEPALAGQPARYAAVTGSPRVVRMPDYMVQQFRKKPADFKAPVTPQPESAVPSPIEVPAEVPESKPVK